MFRHVTPDPPKKKRKNRTLKCTFGESCSRRCRSFVRLFKSRAEEMIVGQRAGRNVLAAHRAPHETFYVNYRRVLMIY
jgi:hypothetical protein